MTDKEYYLEINDTGIPRIAWVLIRDGKFHELIPDESGFSSGFGFELNPKYINKKDLEEIGYKP